MHPLIVLWCNGSTTGFGSVCSGSNPLRTTEKEKQYVNSCFSFSFLIAFGGKREIILLLKKDFIYIEEKFDAILFIFSQEFCYIYLIFLMYLIENQVDIKWSAINC